MRRFKKNGMKKFNVNGYIYVQLTKKGIEHIKSKNGLNYFKEIVESRKQIINGDTWYRLQFHMFMDIVENTYGKSKMFNSTVMFSEDDLKNT